MNWHQFFIINAAIYSAQALPRWASITFAAIFIGLAVHAYMHRM